MSLDVSLQINSLNMDMNPQPVGTEPIPPKSTAVKTDKPRPHVCATCTRSFARLEHLKRHERSHTKEKPFQCPVCERCFARRDLLLRHKQKLHASFPNEPRKQQGKRGSASGAAGRKNSIKKEDDSSVSPSSVTAGSVGGGTNTSPPSLYSSLLKNKVSGATNRTRTMSFSAASSTSYASNKQIEEYNSHPEFHPSAPPQVGFSTPQLLPHTFSDSSDSNPFEDFFTASDPLYINPQQLFGGHSFLNSMQQNQLSQQHQQQQQQQHQQHHQQHSQHQHQQQHQHQHQQQHDRHDSIISQVLDHEPSAVTPTGPTGSVSGPSGPRGSSVGMDDDFSWLSPAPHSRPGATPQSILSATPAFSDTPAMLSRESPLPMNAPINQSSSHPNHPHPPAPSTTTNAANASTISTTHSNDRANDIFNLNFALDDANGNGNGNMKSSSTNRAKFDWPVSDEFWKLDPHSLAANTGVNTGLSPALSSTTVATGPAGSSKPKSIPDATSHVITSQLRLHILTALSTPAPMSSNSSPQLPSTLELQRYVNAYVENFGKHMPFLHHTLEFNSDNAAVALGMAAIGALYTFEQSNASAIFDMARSCIHAFLESHKNDRKPSVGDETKDTSAVSGGIEQIVPANMNTEATPLWLIQALVLGTIYGLFSGEPLANDIAVSQANAVISLTKSAGLWNSPAQYMQAPSPMASEHEKWLYFIKAQERIRTMHVVHMMSALLATTYNISLPLRNSDVKCGTPCDESLWTAQNASAWWAVVHQKELDKAPLAQACCGVEFSDYLHQLLQGSPLMSKVPQFTLLSLMYAIHLEIHELKVAHDRDFMMDDKEPSASSSGSAPSPNKRHRSLTGSSFVEQDDHIVARERAWLDKNRIRVVSILQAWETTWSLSPLASLSPSSQYGPLMSDSIPLNTLAHVRLYLDLRRVKEAFWRRDFEAMGHQLDSLVVPTGIIDEGTGKSFNNLLEAASYGADTISLWEKHSVRWTLETSVSQTFIHTIVTLFDCGLVVSEFLNRLESNMRTPADWTEEEKFLVNRLVKIFYRVVEVLGHEDIDEDLSGAVLDLDSKPHQHNGRRLSILSLQVVSKILCKSYIWPFALVMGNALQARSAQIKKYL